VVNSEENCEEYLLFDCDVGPYVDSVLLVATGTGNMACYVVRTNLWALSHKLEVLLRWRYRMKLNGAIEPHEDFSMRNAESAPGMAFHTATSAAKKFLKQLQVG